MSTTPPADHPLLVAAPGMTLAEVVASSSMPLDHVDLGGKQVAQPRPAHRVSVRCPECGFELPPGRFSIVETEGPIVVRLRATPQLDAFVWEEAIEHLNALAALLDQAGWEAHERPVPTTIAEHLTSASEDRAGQWRHGALRAELWLRRIVTAGTRSAELLRRPAGSYLVTVVLWDERLCGYPSVAHRETT